MTRPMPPVHSRFKPGQSGNPGGNRKLPEELRAIQALTQAECSRLVAKYARLTRAELQEKLQDQSTPMLEITIASIFVQSAKSGDYQRLSFLLDRACGKVPNVLDLEQDDSLSKLSIPELVALVKEKLPELEKAG